MCEPATIIMAATAIYGAVETRNNARRQERALMAQQEVEETELNRAMSVEADDRVKQARAERARLRAMSAESGVSGLAIDELLGNVDMQLGTDLARLDQNSVSRVRASRTGLNSNLNRVEQPDWVGTGLQIAGASYQSYQANPQTRNNG
jgi:hypothetical protein